jgi:hypothetical protein
MWENEYVQFFGGEMPEGADPANQLARLLSSQIVDLHIPSGASCLLRPEEWSRQRGDTGLSPGLKRTQVFGITLASDQPLPQTREGRAIAVPKNKRSLYELRSSMHPWAYHFLGVYLHNRDAALRG